MKKFIIIIVILTLNFMFSTLNCVAQPNGGFENWNIVAGVESPLNWQTLNFLAAFSNPVSAFKASGVDKHSGNYALKLKTIYIPNNPFPNLLPDTTSGAFTGKIIMSPFSFKLGIPYTGRPEKLEFWFKYIPVADDVAGVSVELQKWNGTHTDTIANSDLKIYATAAYTLLQVDLNYRSTESPDTLFIAFTSSFRQSLARVGSTFYIDDVAMTGWVSIDESHTPGTDKVKIFPNPAKDDVTIRVQIDEADKLHVVDVSGKLAGDYKIQNFNSNINTSMFAEGLYFFEVQDKNEKILTKGKFNVVK